jgi:hypothetical protein
VLLSHKTGIFVVINAISLSTLSQTFYLFFFVFFFFFLFLFFFFFFFFFFYSLSLCLVYAWKDLVHNICRLIIPNIRVHFTCICTVWSVQTVDLGSLCNFDNIQLYPLILLRGLVTTRSSFCGFMYLTQERAHLEWHNCIPTKRHLVPGMYSKHLRKYLYKMGLRLALFITTGLTL